ncbi:MAG: class I tRNA ligase family protein [Candidatus Peribacteria bacterium]|nr:MAG: class I tRNA ligase family protein [Candidatus Peribacteria bacterium]
MMLAVEDTMVRHARMDGKTTVWIPGTDHAGISTQVVVERQLLQNHKKTRFDLGREKFLQQVWRWVTQCRSTITDQTKRMGASCDWEREQFTMSEKLSRSVRKAFKNMYESKKIFKSTYMVNRSPGAQTVVSDLEVEFHEEEGKLYYLRYFIEGKGDSITVATTRPETIFADVAVAVHPKDRRYKKFIGRNVLIPIVNRAIPVIADENVAIDFGTGALKITPTHDETDFAVGQKHNLPMDRFALDKDNNFTEWAGEELAGKNAYDFFDNLIQHLHEIGNLEKVETHMHSVPYCERTKERIQPMLSQQWFMDVKPAADRIMHHLDEEDVLVHPERFIKTFQSWLEDIRPWCISRQLWWGHRIPVWYDADGLNT